jgi:Arm DNA-binding domain
LFLGVFDNYKNTSQYHLNAICINQFCTIFWLKLFYVCHNFKTDKLKAIKTKYEIIFNRKKKLNSEGLALIPIRMYLNGFNKYYSTGINISPSEWNETAPQHALQTMSMLDDKDSQSVS